MTHTPGPWRIGDAGHTVFGPPNGNPAPMVIAHMAPHNFRANAIVIAAAPDMLYELERVNRRAEDGLQYMEDGDWEGLRMIFAAIRDETRAAIQEVED